MGGFRRYGVNIAPVNSEIVKLSVGVRRQLAYDAPIHISRAEEATQKSDAHGLALIGLAMPSAFGLDDGVIKRFPLLTN